MTEIYQDEGKDTTHAQEDQVASTPKNFGLVGATSFVVGNIVGSGIFVNVAGSAAAAPYSPGLTIIIWLIGGISAICGALSYGELCLYFHKSGGEYAFIDYMYNTQVAASYLFSYNILNAGTSIAYGALTASKYVIAAIYPEHIVSSVCEQYMASVLILSLMVLNMVSIKIPNKIQIVFTIAKVCGLIIIIISGFVYMARDTSNFNNSFNMRDFSSRGLTLAIASSFWSYGGWNTLGHITGEINNPKRNIPIAFISGLCLVITLYLFSIVSYITILGHFQMAHQTTVALGVGYSIFGKYGWIMSIFIVLSTIGFSNGFFYSTARIGMVASHNKTLPEFVGLVHKKTRAPAVSVFLLGINCLIYVFVDFDDLVKYSSYVSWVYYGLCGFGLFYYRIRDKFPIQPEFKVPLIFPIILVISALYIIGMTFYDNPVGCFIILIYMIVSGAVFYIPKSILHNKPCRKILGYLSYWLKIIFNSELVSEGDLYSL